MHKHGTYARKTPDGMRIQRWCCRRCQVTFSALPDCLASHMRGTLDELEQQVGAVESEPSVMSAVRAQFPDCIHDEVPWRRLRRRRERVHALLVVVRGLLPVLACAPLDVLGMRAHLGTAQVLVTLRGLCDAHLLQLPSPLGFRRVGERSGTPRGPPTLDGHGLDASG